MILSSLDGWTDPATMDTSMAVRAHRRSHADGVPAKLTTFSGVGEPGDGQPPVPLSSHSSRTGTRPKRAAVHDKSGMTRRPEGVVFAAGAAEAATISGPMIIGDG